MRFLPVDGLPGFRGAIGLSFLEVDGPDLRVSLSDDWETFVHLTFRPYQGLRVTTEDCFRWPDDFDCFRTVVRVVESPWIRELRAGLRANDPGADFIDRAHHFLIPCQDRIVEVAAWEMTWEIVQRPRGAGGSLP